jgi:dTDP-4-dehydrorhamnose reductase
MYGLDQMDRGTASFAERIERGEPQALFSDALRNPIQVDTLAAAILRLVETTYSGTLNIAGRQVLSRDEYGRRMLEYWGVAARGLLEAARAADISDSIPLDLRLRIDRAERLLGIELPGVDTVLAMEPETAPSETEF